MDISSRVRFDTPDRPGKSRFAGPARGLLLAAPAASTVYLAFNAGGYFVDGTAAVAVALALLLVLRVTLEERPLGRPSAFAAVAILCLTGFAVWTLISGLWSDSWGRAIAEFSRVLTYLLALVLFATRARSPRDLRMMLRWFALAAVVVCGVALASRLLPDLVHSRPNLANSRLSYPITYWNALGLLGVLGTTACLHLASSAREPRTLRVLGAAAIPLLSVTVYFTFSRGALLAGVIALLLFLMLGWSRGLLVALVSSAPAATVAVVAAYGAEQLASRNPTAPAASSQADRVLAATLLAMGGAAALRAVLLSLGWENAPSRLSARARRRTVILAAGLVGVALVAGAFALDAPAKLERQYDRFVEGSRVGSRHDARSRFTDPGNNGRIDYWEVSVDAWREESLRGAGAGGWQFLWARNRPGPADAINGHSLYLEVLAELGIVGGLLLAGAILALIAGMARRLPGPERPVFAALLVMSVALALHAGIDWDWEMPVVALWFFALAGAALARADGEGPPPVSPARLPRVVIGLACMALAVTPALLFLSQRQLNRSVEAFKRGDCGEAIDAALASTSALPVRHEPFEVLAYCDVRAGKPALAVRMMNEAVERDPEDWRLRYGLALVRGAAELDPRAEARKALRLNPRSSLTRSAARRFAGSSAPRTWRR
ncbi:MAG TPA: O-antigen ligase family protein, partial [Thermoleophilaceae bacterium]|nr:O-antigen ligase family protein [Thermoleophilaceae bacterium]